MPIPTVTIYTLKYVYQTQVNLPCRQAWLTREFIRNSWHLCNVSSELRLSLWPYHGMVTTTMYGWQVLEPPCMYHIQSYDTWEQTGGLFLWTGQTTVEYGTFFYGAYKFFDQHKWLYMYQYKPCILLWFGWSMGISPFLILCILLMVIEVYLCPCAETSFVEIHRTIRIRHHRS